MDIDGFDSPEGIICLGIDKITAVIAEGVTDIIIKRIGEKVAVNTRNGDQHRVSGFFMKQNAIKQNTTFCYRSRL